MDGRGEGDGRSRHPRQARRPHATANHDVLCRHGALVGHHPRHPSVLGGDVLHLGDRGERQRSLVLSELAHERPRLQ